MCILLLLAGGVYAQQKTVRILAIGNSFSQDAVEQYLHELAEAEGIGAAALEDIRQGRKLIDIELWQALGHGAPPELNPAFAIGRDAHLLGALFTVPARYCPDPANSYSGWLARQERRRVID